MRVDAERPDGMKRIGRTSWRETRNRRGSSTTSVQNASRDIIGPNSTERGSAPKIDRLAQEGDGTLLDFLSIVLCCDGTALRNNPANFYWSLSTYFAPWDRRAGEFEKAKTRLVADGIIKETWEHHLCINHPKPKDVAEELGDYLFARRADHYDKLLTDILRVPENRFFLERLAALAPVVRHTDLAEIYAIVGQERGRQAEDTLLKNALLVWETGSNKYNYYRLIPQIRNLAPFSHRL